MLPKEDASMAERQISSEKIFDGKLIHLRVDTIELADGRRATREVVAHPPAVVMLAENERGEVILVRQHRYPVGENTIEIPAGIVEHGEDYAEAARRELQEEAGYYPDKVDEIMRYYPSSGYSDEEFIFFHATELRKSKLPEDDDENIVASFATREEVAELINSGTLRDAKTIIALYWYLAKSGI